jgi:hypothetical protein
MMDDFDKELLTELIKEWNISKIEEYIAQLEQRLVKIDDWIKYVKTIRRKKVRKIPLDTGTRGGL